MVKRKTRDYIYFLNTTSKHTNTHREININVAQKMNYLLIIAQKFILNLKE
jgi:thiosulfate reductase cytochrome b subunit